MKTWSILVALFVLALSVSVAMAEGEAKAKTLRGAITKVDGNNITVGTTTFATDGSTVVTTSSGEKKAASDLAAGQTIVVKLNAEGTTATMIVVTPAAGDGGLGERQNPPGAAK